MSRISYCFFCGVKCELEYFLRPDDDAIDYSVNACHDCYEKRTKHNE